MSLETELQLAASPKNFKEADDVKVGFLVLIFGFFFCMVCLGCFVNYPPTPPKQKKFLHAFPRRGLRGKELENCWNTHSGKTDRTEVFQEHSLPGDLHACSPQFPN